MPRRPRALVDDGIYHVYNRGNDRIDLFRCEEDFHSFLNLLLEAKQRFSLSIYHYCLMTNHFHLFVRVRQGDDLPKSMHSVQLAYTRVLKKRYEHLGHAFQGRFRSPLISKESYYLQCGRYIERNPVKAGMVKRAEDYEYSSARYYVFGRKDPLITPDEYYLELGNTDEERRKEYRDFLSLEEPYSEMVDEMLQMA